MEGLKIFEFNNASDMMVVQIFYCLVGTGFLIFTIFVIIVFAKYYPSSSIFQIVRVLVCGSELDRKNLNYFNVKLLSLIVCIRIIYFLCLKVTALYVFSTVVMYVTLISLVINGVILRIIFEVCLTEMNFLKLLQVSKNWLNILINYVGRRGSVLFSMFPAIRNIERISDYGYNNSEIRSRRSFNSNTRTNISFSELKKFNSFADYSNKEIPYYVESTKLKAALLSMKEYKVLSARLMVNSEVAHTMVFSDIHKDFYRFYPKFELASNYAYLINDGDRDALWATDVASIDWCVRNQRISNKAGSKEFLKSNFAVSWKEREEICKIVRNFSGIIRQANGDPKIFHQALLDDPYVKSFQKDLNPNWINGLSEYGITQFRQLEAKNIAIAAFSGQEVVYPMDTKLVEFLEEFRKSHSEVLSYTSARDFSTAIGDCVFVNPLDGLKSLWEFKNRHQKLIPNFKYNANDAILLVPFVNHTTHNVNFFSETFNFLEDSDTIIKGGEDFGKLLTECGILKYSIVGTDIGFVLEFKNKKIDDLYPFGVRISAVSDNAVMFEISELDRIAFELRCEIDPIRRSNLELYQKNLQLFISGMKRSNPGFNENSLSRQTLIRINLYVSLFL